jgi:Class II flagellar assembly regulator
VVGKIEGTGPVRTAQQIRRAVKASGPSGTSFSKQLDETSETGASQAMSGASSIMGVLGVQEIDDALAQASRGKMRALDILDRLEDLRIELLSGAISREKLTQLSQVVSARRAETTDPRLAEVLDEIDLRAQVELAKYGD